MIPELFYDKWRKEKGITIEGYQLSRKQILQMLADYKDEILPPKKLSNRK